MKVKEAEKGIQDDANFKEFYNILSTYDIYALHKTMFKDKIINDRIVKSGKLIKKFTLTDAKDVELFNNHGFIFTSILFLPKDVSTLIFIEL
jgi:hypothetical protein